MKAIETIYNGYRFRSRLEARWAVFFDNLEIAYEYEPQGFVMNSGVQYLPDFYLPSFHCYFEVKHRPSKIIRNLLPYDDFADAIGTLAYESEVNNEFAGIIAFGDPSDHYMWIFCKEDRNGEITQYDAPVVFEKDPRTKDIYLLAWDDDDSGSKVFRTGFSQASDQIPMFHDSRYWHVKAFHGVHDDIIQAETQARQARFEYGENPKRKRW